MKKLLVVVMCLAMIMTAFAGCSSSTSTGGGAPEGEGEVIKIVVAHVYSTNSTEDEYLRYFKEKLEERTEGKVEVTIYANGQMGSEREIAEQVVMGTVDMGFHEGSMWATALNNPKLSVTGLPYLYSDIAGQAAVMEEIIIPVAEDLYADTVIVPLFSFTQGLREFMPMKAPITKLEDIKGLKVRTPEIPLFVETLKSLGANPTTSSWSEAYQILSQGVVDAIEVDMATAVEANMQELVKYVSKTGHLGGINIFGMNKTKWDTIPEDIQTAIKEVGMEAQAEQIKARIEVDKKYEQTMIDAGVIINEIAPEELERMAAAMAPIYQEFVDYGLGDVIKQIQEVAKNAPR